MTNNNKIMNRRSCTELKEIFHEGWNHPGRVDNCVCNTAEKEFAPGKRCEAWLRVLATTLATERRLKVLDVGTGPGIFACLYAQLGHDCTGLDFSERMVAAARERATRLSLDCTFVHADAEAPPFPDASFDVVSSRHVLYTLPQPGKAVRQWTRVLKSGGKMIVIAEDLHNRKLRPGATNVERIRRWFEKVWRKDIGNVKGWTASPAYYEALYECPLAEYHTHVGVLHAVLEAAGLEQINAFAADEVYEARLAGVPTRKNSPHAVDRPFVVTGVKL